MKYASRAVQRAVSLMGLKILFLIAVSYEKIIKTKKAVGNH